MNDTSFLEKIPFSVGGLRGWYSGEDSKSLGRVLLIHGIGEHSFRHAPTIRALNRENLETVRFDLRGAGQSEGRRQYVDSFYDYVEDAAAVLNWIQRTLPAKPLFVLGHSLGGAIAAHFAARYGKSWRGLILSAPAYLVGNAISPLKIRIGKLLVKRFPLLKVPAKSDFQGISRIPEVVEAYQADPLACHFSTLRQGDEVLKALEAMPVVMQKIQTPVCFFHGTADTIIRCQGTPELLQRIASKDKCAWLMPGAFHELHNDLDAAEYFQHLTHWILRRAAQAPDG